MKYTKFLLGMMIVGGTIGLPQVFFAEELQAIQQGLHNRAASQPPSALSTDAPHHTLSQSQDKPVPESPAITAYPLLYKPPLGVGSPRGLVAGGSRSARNCQLTYTAEEKDHLILSLLAPANHVGLTSQEQPVLYWYLSKATNCQIELTLIDDHSVEPLLEIKLPPPRTLGIQRFSLADYEVHLLAGVQYQWAVALVPDPTRRSQDVVAAGGIQRVDAAQGWAELSHTEKSEAATRYAAMGLWYDAVATLSDLISEEPQTPGWRLWRASLLEQGQLPEVAAQERVFGKP